MGGGRGRGLVVRKGEGGWLLDLEFWEVWEFGMGDDGVWGGIVFVLILILQRTMRRGD